jgi:mono/diheme cytochrome c family protein
MKPRRGFLLVLMLATPLLLALLAVFLVLLARQGGLDPFQVPTGGSPPATSAAQEERGRYLATLGNCAGCHTAPGGTPLAGGRGFRTGYGTVYSTNLTPDATHGIGAWSAAEFRHAMRHGVSRNGVLSPVFPYASFRHLSDADLDALLGYLRGVAASDRPRRANRFRFPANLPGAMIAWRMLTYRPSPAVVPADAIRARGAYLVEGIGHCATCHASRGTLASQEPGGRLGGARNAGWYAPALHGPALMRFAPGEVAGYLKGDAPRAIGGYGLMADVIARNLQHLAVDDARAIEQYLRSLPAPAAAQERTPSLRVRASPESLATGRAVYRAHCADCHGERSEGEDGKFPPLRRSPALAQQDPINAIKLVLFGAVAPSTPGNPAPHTMPPLAQALSPEEVASVVNLLRLQENDDARPVGVDDVRALGAIDAP